MTFNPPATIASAIVWVAMASACGDNVVQSPGSDAGLDAADTDSSHAFSLTMWGAADEMEIGDDGATPYTWGLQGGTMIRPTLTLSPDGGFEVGEEITLNLIHDPDPEFPDEYPVFSDYERVQIPTLVREHDGRLVAGPVDDQISWDSMEGARLRFTVAIDGFADESITRDLLLFWDRSDPCTQFADPDRQSGECGMAVVAGTIQLWQSEPAESANGCPGPVWASEGIFGPTEEAAQSCVAPWFRPAVPGRFYFDQACMGTDGPSDSVEATALIPIGECEDGSVRVVIDGADEGCVCSFE